MKLEFKSTDFHFSDATVKRDLNGYLEKAAECANARLPELIKPLEEKLTECRLELAARHQKLRICEEALRMVDHWCRLALARIREGEK